MKKFKPEISYQKSKTENKKGIEIKWILKYITLTEKIIHRCNHEELVALIKQKPEIQKIFRIPDKLIQSKLTVH